MHNSNGETTLYKLDPPSSSAPSTRQLQNTVIPIDDNMLNLNLTDQENGGNAKIMKGNNGRYVVEIVLPDGLASLFTEDNVYTYNPANSPASESVGVSYSQPYTNLGEDAAPRQGVQSPPRQPSDIYVSLLPQGVPRRQIPPGEEDMYILKTEVIPPVCPKCPSTCPAESNKSKKCAPCPAPARCPEPDFDCEKVPVYPQYANSNSSQQNSEYSYSSMMGPLTTSNSGSSSTSSTNTGSSSTSSGSSSTSSNQGGSADSADYQPLPTLNSFSAFGM